jgi:methylphosphotriester-DNA--protein-cysteine methyltransferase
MDDISSETEKWSSRNLDTNVNPWTIAETGSRRTKTKTSRVTKKKTKVQDQCNNLKYQLRTNMEYYIKELEGNPTGLRFLRNQFEIIFTSYQIKVQTETNTDVMDSGEQIDEGGDKEKGGEEY